MYYNTKSYDFSIRIVKLAQYLSKDKKAYILNKQMHESLLKDNKELVSLLVSITKTLKNKGITK